MKKDPAIDAIRKTRHAISKKCGHDTQALLARYRSLESKYADRMVKEDPATWGGGDVLKAPIKTGRR